MTLLFAWNENGNGITILRQIFRSEKSWPPTAQYCNWLWSKFMPGSNLLLIFTIFTYRNKISEQFSFHLFTPAISINFSVKNLLCLKNAYNVNLPDQLTKRTESCPLKSINDSFTNLANWEQEIFLRQRWHKTFRLASRWASSFFFIIILGLLTGFRPLSNTFAGLSLPLTLHWKGKCVGMDWIKSRIKNF